ncbi:hypothetical protein FBU31_001308, partial [Coemansia sp. 'formosensis']
MHSYFDRLEDRVLDRIIALAFYQSDVTRKLADFKRLLPLAAVNHAWRQLATPHIYATLIVECQPSVSRKPDPKPRSKGVWARSEKTNGGGLPLTRTTSSTTVVTTTAQWQTNLGLILGGPKHSAITRLCIQAFDIVPDYAALLDTFNGSFGHHQWSDIATIEIRDCSTIRRAPLPDPASSMASSRSSSSSSLSPMGATLRTHKPGHAHATGVTKLAALISKHAPNVTALVSEPWECTPGSRSLAGHLALTYFHQLRICNAPLGGPIVGPKHEACLASLCIQTSMLQASGAHGISVLQLHTLKLLQAEAFFSWEAFGTATATTLEFCNLTTLTIDFEKDHVANDSHKYDAQKGKNPRVSMGVDKRRVLFPKLTNLCVRKLPYTYPEAWAMFLDSPIKNLALAGKFAHIRYLDTRVLRNLDIFDIHVYLSDKSFGKFTTFVKTVLSVDSSVKSAWIRHSEVFPISVPDACLWAGLQELNITAYIPTFTLLALVSQLPALYRLIAQRIARDDSEAPLESEAGPFYIEPGAVASTS